MEDCFALNTGNIYSLVSCMILQFEDILAQKLRHIMRQNSFPFPRQIIVKILNLYIIILCFHLYHFFPVFDKAQTSISSKVHLCSHIHDKVKPSKWQNNCPPSSQISSCVRTVDTVMCLHTWPSPALGGEGALDLGLIQYGTFFVHHPLLRFETGSP